MRDAGYSISMQRWLIGEMLAIEGSDFSPIILKKFLELIRSGITHIRTYNSWLKFASLETKMIADSAVLQQA